MQNKIFDISLSNLKFIEDNSYTIPSYQRPYVWQDEDIKKLLDDCYLTFLDDGSKEYYIGGILVKKQADNQFELIDGQQRFTTLWLIAFIFKKLKIESEICEFLKTGNGLKLNFEIRDEIGDYFQYLLNPEKPIDEDEIKRQPYLENIAKCLTTIENYLESREPGEKARLSEFGNYLYTKLTFIINLAPEKTDLNKLFSVINSTGIQLEQSDIVKAELLHKLSSEKVLYGKIWEACENMDDYFERNIRKIFTATDFNNINLENNDEIGFDKEIFKYKQDTAENINDYISALSIAEIIKKNNADTDKNTDENNAIETTEKFYCRSIISFPQLLLHTYRIYLIIKNEEDFTEIFHSNNLIKIFKPLQQKDENEIKNFIKLLWEIRYLFDKYLIKWITDTDSKEETLELMKFSKNSEGYYSRTKFEKSELLILQSVLYFTGDYLRQYWLTPFLKYLYDIKGIRGKTEVDNAAILRKLEYIDNVMSLSQETGKKFSFDLCKLKEINTTVIDTKAIGYLTGYFNKNMGTGFKHYWFYKLEYILWKNWTNKDDTKFKSYRIRSKNSVEHIYPQNPELIEKLSSEYSDSFGNLVLLSVSQNSEYSNKTVQIKKSVFQSKGEYDTLKSYYIFKNDSWGKKEIEAHKSAMIEKIITHYKEVNHANI